LAFRLRPGNAGSNTAVDHIEVLDEAIVQVPARYRRNMLITCDGAGATLDLVKHVSKLNTAPHRYRPLAVEVVRAQSGLVRGRDHRL
jgi:hypothetical protein